MPWTEGKAALSLLSLLQEMLWYSLESLCCPRFVLDETGLVWILLGRTGSSLSFWAKQGYSWQAQQSPWSSCSVVSEWVWWCSGKPCLDDLAQRSWGCSWSPGMSLGAAWDSGIGMGWALRSQTIQGSHSVSLEVFSSLKAAWVFPSLGVFAWQL